MVEIPASTGHAARVRHIISGLLIFLVALTARGAPIPPGHEAEVSRLVAGERLAEGEVLAIRIGAQSIEVDLSTPDGPLTLALEAHDTRSKEREVGRSASFIVLERRGAAGEGARRVTSLFVDGLRARDAGTFFPSIAKAAPESSVAHRHELGWWDGVKRAVSWTALVICLLLLAIGTRVSRWQTLGLVALVLAGWGLRLWLPPQAPLHANAHGIAELRGLVGAAVPWYAADESTRYGPAFRDAVRPMLAWTGAGTDGFFRLNTLFSALGVFAVFAFARSLTGSRVAGWAAAVALAIHPVNVRVASSESPMPLAILLTLIALAAWDAALKREENDGRAMLLGWTGGFALALASELAVTTLALAAAVVLYALVTGPRRRLVSLLLPAVFVAFTALVHLWVLSPLLEEARIDRGETLLPFWKTWMGPANLLFDETLGSPLLLPLAGLGLLAIATRGRWRAALGLALAGIVVLAASFPVIQARTDLLRYQVLAHAFVLITAGAAAAFVPAFVALRGQLVGALVVVVILITGALPGLDAIRKPTLDDSAFLAVKEAAAALPDRLSVVITPRVAGQPFTDFPGYLLEESGKSVTVVADRTEATGACFVHVSAGCWAFPREEIEQAIATAPRFDGEPIQPRCAQHLEGIVPPAQTARRVAVPWREGEFYAVPADRPWVGLFPCGGR